MSRHLNRRMPAQLQIFVVAEVEANLTPTRWWVAVVLILFSSGPRRALVVWNKLCSVAKGLPESALAVKAARR
jgi:hypothetical protein